jgi:ADP-ribose pyrophosphatase YjhB (NUDIX family)
MTTRNEPDWLRWVRSLDAVAQAGLNYGPHPYDRDRYEAVRTVAAEMAAAATGLPASEIRDGFASEAGHPTPKVDVRGAVFRDGRILLVQEAVDGGWTLPGGWADPGDTPARTTEREVREEAGLSVRATKLIALVDRDTQGHPSYATAAYKVFFLCEETGEPEREPDHEILAVGWFDPLDPPPLSESRVTREQLALAASHAADPSLPTAFD